MSTSHERGPLWRRGQSQPVGPLELLFDLVFVFAISQLAQHLHDNLHWTGAAQTAVLHLVILAVWFNSIWVANLLEPSRLPVRALLLIIMLLSGVMAASVMDAFGERGWLLAGGYVLFQFGRPVFMLCIRPDAAMRRNFMRILIWAVPISAAWVVGASVEDAGVRLAIWGAAAAIEYVSIWRGHPVPGMGRTDTDSYELSGAHIAERCRLFFLIAVGETVVAGLAAFAGEPLSPVRSAALAVGFIGTIAIWWIYFHRGESIGMSEIEESSDEAAIGKRAIYTLVILVAGLIVVAVGDELVIAEPTAATTPTLSVVLYGGPALFLAGSAWFFRKVGSRKHVSRSRMVAIAALAVLAVVTSPLSALVAASGAALVLVALAAFDTRAAAKERSSSEQ